MLSKYFNHYRVSSKLWLFENVTRLNFPSSAFGLAMHEFVSDGDDDERFSFDDFATEVTDVTESEMFGFLLFGTDTGICI